MKDRKHKFIGIFLALMLSALAVYPQASPNPIKLKPEEVASFVEKHELDSKLMQRKMPYQVIVPNGYYEKKNETNKYSVVYLLHGLTGHYDNWTSKTKLPEVSRNYPYILVFPEGDNGWYSDSVSIPTDKYESYIVSELMPEVEKKFRTKTARENRAIAGLSMGGYGALKFGLKYPEKFAVVGSFSGALRATEIDAKDFGGWKVLADSINSAFGEIGSESRKANNIFDIIAKQTPETLKNLPFIYLDCGTEDFLIKDNQAFSDALLVKKIPHEFRQLPGKHDWVFWNSQVQEFLELSERFLK